MDIFEAVVAAHRPALCGMAWAALGRVGVLAALPETAEVLASSLGLVPHKLVAVLEALAFEGALVRTGTPARYARAGAEPATAGVDTASLPGWASLAEILCGAPPASAPPETLSAYHTHLTGIAAAKAPALWDAIGAHGARLVDLGGGLGAYAAAFVARRPGASARVLDTPEVVALAVQRGAPVGVCFAAADLFEASGEADVVLLANVLHLYGPEQAAQLVAQAATLLVDGGVLVVEDLALDGAGGPAHAAWFNVNMAVFTEGGRVYQSDEVRAWLRAAGLVAEGDGPWTGRVMDSPWCAQDVELKG